MADNTTTLSLRYSIM